MLGVTAVGADMKAAIDKAYQDVNLIKFNNMYFRKDIAQKAFRHIKTK